MIRVNVQLFSVETNNIIRVVKGEYDEYVNQALNMSRRCSMILR